MGIIVFDIDGTLSLVGDRLKYLEGDNKDWDAFYEACGEDDLNATIAAIYDALSYYTVSRIICVTGRRESCRKDTLEWFKNHNLPLLDSDLYMRPNGDYRHDTIVKFELIEHLLDDVILVFEDRNSMVQAWRDRGIVCCQVADGDF